MFRHLARAITKRSCFENIPLLLVISLIKRPAADTFYLLLSSKPVIKTERVHFTCLREQTLFLFLISRFELYDDTVLKFK